MEPLEVVIHLKTPIALGFPWVFFDSLLTHLKIMEEFGERYYSLPTKIASVEVDIPVKKWRDVYVASVSIFEPSDVGLQVFQYFKRGDFPFPRGKISKGSGFFKDFYLRVAYVPAQRVRFYCTCEKGEVERLLAKLPAVGKDKNIGFGFIRRIEVNEVESEWGLVKDGLAMRPIPVTYLRSYEDATYMPYKPPYWDKKSIALCAVPFTRVEL